jgi:PhnB protein
MLVQPYLFFDGKCEEALNYYKSKLGAKVDMMMRFKESPETASMQGLPANSGEKIMHSAFHIGDTQLMASDGMCGGKPNFQGLSLSIAVDNDATAERMFNALKADGKAQMPMTETFFASRFGVVADKFGVSWMIIHGKDM